MPAENNSYNQSFISRVTFHQSKIVLTFYLLILEIAIVITSILIRLPEGFLLVYIGGNTLYFINIVIDIILTIGDVSCILLLVLQWYNGYYEILPGKVLYNNNDDFFKRQEKEFPCNAIANVTLIQNSLGKAFDFGTLILYSSNTNEPFYLYNIPNLKSNLPIIQNALMYRASTSN